MVRVETRRCGKYRTLLQIPKYGGQNESREEFLETQSATFALRFAVLLSFKYWNTVRLRKRQHRSVFRLRPRRRGSFTPKRPCANRKCCARSTSPVGIASRPREGSYEFTSSSGPPCNSNICSDPGNLCSRGRRFLSGAQRRLDAVNVRSIRYSNQFQIVRRKDFPFRVLHFQSAHGFSGTFVQNLKTFLAAREETTFSPLTQSNDDREQLSAFWG